MKSSDTIDNIKENIQDKKDILPNRRDQQCQGQDPGQREHPPNLHCEHVIFR